MKNKGLFVILAMFVLYVMTVSSARLPIAGSDSGSWGTILNEFLNVSLTESGNIRNGIVMAGNLNLSDILLTNFTNNAGYLTHVVNFSGIYSDLFNKPVLTVLSNFTNDVGYLTTEINPTNATIQIGTSQVNGLINFIIANEVNPTNNTILINTGQVTGLANFVVGNEKNPSNATIFIPSTQLTDIGDIMKVSNFANAFDSNLSVKTTTNLAEGTNLYFTNDRTDSRFNTLFVGAFNTNLSVATINTGQITGLSAFVVANEKNPSNATISIPISQLSGLSASAGKAVCWKTATTLGYCSNQPDVNGVCTCN